MTEETEREAGANEATRMSEEDYPEEAGFPNDPEWDNEEPMDEDC